jgi:hypothetical protein
MGHYLGNLLHTHEDTYGLEFVDGTNCAEAGDLLCQTAADPGPAWLNPGTGCTYDASTCKLVSCGNDLTGATYQPNPRNFLSYGPSTCRDHFEHEQEQMILCSLEKIRQELVPVVAADCDDGKITCGNVCVDLKTDEANCGACGHLCGPAATCASGSCCKEPYHVVSASQACVWSCAAGTEPDAASNECACVAGAIPKGFDAFGRMVCETPAPALRYAFDGNAANTGSWPGYAGWVADVSWVSGYSGKAIRFNATATSQLILPGSAGVFNSSPKLTVALRFREDAVLPSLSSSRDLLSNRTTSGVDRGIDVYHGVYNAPWIYTCSSAGCATITAPAGVWHHLAFRYAGLSAANGGGANIELFLDGAAAGTLANPTGLPVFSQVADLVVGRNTNFTVDDLSVYARVFTDTDQCAVLLGGKWSAGKCNYK